MAVFIVSLETTFSLISGISNSWQISVTSFHNPGNVCSLPSMRTCLARVSSSNLMILKRRSHSPSPPCQTNTPFHKPVKMKTYILIAAYLSSVLAAPQYGNIGGSAPQPQRTPSSGSSIRCRTEQTTVWDTRYVETQENICNTMYVNECQTLYERQCLPTTREVCQTTNEQQCSTSYREECHDEFRTEYETYTETECSTTYKEDCQYHWEGAGNDKKWVPDRSTCRNNPYEHCEDVEKQNERQVPYPVCNQVPVKNCINVPVNNCQQVPDHKCTNEPYQKCEQVPNEVCHVEHKKTPHRVSRTVPKKVCDGGNAGSGVGVRSGEEQENQVELETEKDNAIVFSL